MMKLSNTKLILILFLFVTIVYLLDFYILDVSNEQFWCVEVIKNFELGNFKNINYEAKNTKRFKPLSRLVFRPGLFHSIKAISKKGLYALEIERPYIKKDLVRLKDSYGRKLKDYEGKKYIENLNSKLIKFIRGFIFTNLTINRLLLKKQKT